MSVSRDEMERRRRLAEEAAQEVDPSDIEGLAPPPTSPPKSQKLETQQAPDRRMTKRTVAFGPPGTNTQVTLNPPPQPVDRKAEARQLMEEVRSSLSPERKAEAEAARKRAEADAARKKAEAEAAEATRKRSEAEAARKKAEAESEEAARKKAEAEAAREKARGKRQYSNVPLSEDGEITF